MTISGRKRCACSYATCCGHLPGQVMALLDNSSTHKGEPLEQLLRQHPRLQIEHFPSYAPELNPDEGVWCQAKRELANSCPHDIDELMEDIIRTINGIARSKKKIASLHRAVRNAFFFALIHCIIYAYINSIKNIRISCSVEAVGPVTLGTFRPVLIFPRKYFDTVSEADFASAVAHELAHVRRHDFLLNLIYEVLRLPVSFHPAAFLIKARIDETRELACDEIATECLSTSTQYARSLLTIAQSMSAIQRPAIVGYALGLFD